MPQRRNARKALRTNHKHKMHNLDIKTDLKKTLKAFQATISEKKADEAKSQLKIVYKKIDKAAKRNLIHKNTASRRKAHFSRLVASLA